MWISIIDGNTTYRYDNGKLYTQNTETKNGTLKQKVLLQEAMLVKFYLP